MARHQWKAPRGRRPGLPPREIRRGGPRVQTEHATRCERSDAVDGGLVFAEDHEIRIYLDAFDLGAVADLTDESPEARFAQVTTTTDKKLKGQSLIVALEPISSYWVYTAKFQSLANSRERRFKALEHAAQHEEGIVEGLRALGVSPLETGDHLVAVCFKPERPADASTATPRVYRDVHGPRACRALYGVVPDLKEALGWLIGSETTKRLLEETEKNELSTIPYWIFPRDARGERPLSKRKLEDATIGAARIVLEGSALRALAGPPDLIVGRPVVHRMAELYCEQMNALNRRVARGVVKSRPTPAEEDATQDVEEVFPVKDQADLEWLVKLAAESGHDEAERRALELIERHQSVIVDSARLLALLADFEAHDPEVESILLRVRDLLRKKLR